MATPPELSPEQLAALEKEDLGPLAKNIIIAFTVLAFVSVCLRWFTRLKYKAVGWEDHFILLAMVFSIATSFCLVQQVQAGNGKHAMFVPFPDKVEVILKYLFWSIITYNLALTFTKISIVLQYKRIFTVREMRIPIHLAMAICIAWGIAMLFVGIFSCVPVNAYWKVLEKANAKCIQDETIWFVSGAINILTDLMIAILPVKALWGLQIPKRQKLALVGILTIGWFVCIVSILRLNALVVLSKHPDDRTYYTADTAYWSAIEVNLGIVCASLPALKPLVVKAIPWFSSRHSSRGYGTNLSGRMGETYGYSSRGTRGDDEVELATKTINANVYSSKTGQDVLERNIYVTQNVEQHFESNGQCSNSDAESQKDLVTNTAFPTPYAKV